VEAAAGARVLAAASGAAGGVAEVLGFEADHGVAGLEQDVDAARRSADLAQQLRARDLDRHGPAAVARRSGQLGERLVQECLDHGVPLRELRQRHPDAQAERL